MKLVKKIILFFIAFVLTGTVCCYAKTVKKEITFSTKDAKVLKATLSYVKKEGVKKYPTVVLLHSLGYSSVDWGSLIPDLENSGYAVLAVDFRGHGKSIYDVNFKKKSWIYFKKSAFLKYPNDVISILNETQKQAKVFSMDNMVIVGADIGANTAVLVSKELKKKPKALVLISPTNSFKGLYIPVAMAEMGPIPVLSAVSVKDKYSVAQQKDLAKFSQGGFYALNYPQGSMGMMLLKTNPSMASDITKWIKRYLK